MKELELSGPRGALFAAGDTGDADQAYLDHVEKAMSQTVGLAIEGRYDGVASKAAQLVADLQENASSSE